MTLQSENLFNPKMFNPIRDYIDPEVKLNPSPWFKQMQETAPVRYDELRDAWEVFLYEDLQYVLGNPALFSSNRMPPGIAIFQSMVFSDAPRHTKLRNLVSKAFTPKVVSDLAPRIKQVAIELLDNIQGEEIDFIAEYTEPLPIIVIAELLGVSPEDRADFRKWGGAFVKTPQTTDPAELERIMAEQQHAQNELFVYLARMIEERRQNPKNDLVTALTHAEVDGEKLSGDDLLAFCSLLLIAGSETTTNLLAHSMRCLIDMPDLQTQLREKGDLYPSFIEEVLRYRPAVVAVERAVVQDTMLRGQQLKRGQLVVCWLGAGNIDPSRFDRPEQFVIDRNPNPHLTFGFGSHFCLGAPLARLEALIGLQELFKRFQNFQYAPNTKLVPIPTHLVNGVTALPVRLERR